MRPVHRDPATGYRYYRLEQVRDCARIQHFKACGATLRDIQAVLKSTAGATGNRRLLERLRAANLHAIDVARRSLAWIEETLDADTAEPGLPLRVTIRECPPASVVSVRLTMVKYEDVHVHEHALRATVPATVSTGDVGTLWHRCADQAAIEGEPYIELTGTRRLSGVRQLPAVRVASAFSTLDDTEAEATYQRLSRWMHARGHALVGPRREIYRGSLLEIQYPLALA